MQFKCQNTLKNIIKFMTLSLSMMGAKKGKLSGIKEIIVKPHKRINYKLALRIYIVQTFSEEINNIIQEMDTNTFFDQKKQLKLDHPFDLKIWEVDLISEQKPKCLMPPSNKKFFGLYIFIKYVDNFEQSKIQFPPQQKSMVIKFEKGIFVIEKISKRKIASDSKQKRKEFCIELPENDSEPLKPFK